MSKLIVVADDGSWSYVREDGTFDVPLTPRWTTLEVIEPDYDRQLFDLVLDDVQSLDRVSYTIVPKPIEQQHKVIQKRLTDVVQAQLDEKAQQYGYDNIFTACTYVNSTNNKFRSQALAFIDWRDRVWIHCYTVLDDVQQGNREVPTEQMLINELPTFGG